MKTPEGWARATLLLKTLQAPPPAGSLQESVLILLLMRLESIEHAKFRALAQVQIDPKEGVDAFEDYMKIAFPYLDALKRRDRQEFLEILKKEVSKGALQITPVMPMEVKSRLKTRLMKKTRPKSKKETERLYEKIRTEYVPR